MESGEVLLAATAIIAAALAAWTADRRLTKSLAAEERRHINTLAGDSARLQQQLDHDRKMRETDELRSVLDEATSVAAAALDAVASARLKVLSMELTERINYDPRVALAEADQKTQALRSQIQRLSLRLGERYPVTTMYRRVRDPLFDALMLLYRAGNELDADGVEKTVSLIEEAQNQLSRFTSLSQTYVGTPSAVDPEGSAAAVAADL